MRGGPSEGKNSLETLSNEAIRAIGYLLVILQDELAIIKTSKEFSLCLDIARGNYNSYQSLSDSVKKEANNIIVKIAGKIAGNIIMHIQRNAGERANDLDYIRKYLIKTLNITEKTKEYLKRQLETGISSSLDSINYSDDFISFKNSLSHKPSENKAKVPRFRVEVGGPPVQIQLSKKTIDTTTGEEVDLDASLNEALTEETLSVEEYREEQAKMAAKIDHLTSQVRISLARNKELEAKAKNTELALEESRKHTEALIKASKQSSKSPEKNAGKKIVIVQENESIRIYLKSVVDAIINGDSITALRYGGDYFEYNPVVEHKEGVNKTFAQVLAKHIEQTAKHKIANIVLEPNKGLITFFIESESFSTSSKFSSLEFASQIERLFLSPMQIEKLISELMHNGIERSRARMLIDTLKIRICPIIDDIQDKISNNPDGRKARMLASDSSDPFKKTGLTLPRNLVAEELAAYTFEATAGPLIPANNPNMSKIFGTSDKPINTRNRKEVDALYANALFHILSGVHHVLKTPISGEDFLFDMLKDK